MLAPGADSCTLMMQDVNFRKVMLGVYRHFSASNLRIKNGNHHHLPWLLTAPRTAPKLPDEVRGPGPVGCSGFIFSSLLSCSRDQALLPLDFHMLFLLPGTLPHCSPALLSTLWFLPWPLFPVFPQNPESPLSSLLLSPSARPQPPGGHLHKGSQEIHIGSRKGDLAGRDRGERGKITSETPPALSFASHSCHTPRF